MKLQNEIARVAYEIYEKSGKINGRDIENWLEAERLVREKYNKRKGKSGADKPEKRVSSKGGAKKSETKKSANKPTTRKKTK